MGTSPPFSRRRALMLAGAAAGSVALSGPLASAAAAAPGGPPGVTGLRREHWARLVGTRVTVDAPAGRSRPTVVAVTDLAGAPPGDPGRFAVELRSPRTAAAIDALCPVTLPGRGIATLHVAPVERGIRHRTHQIVVNNPTR